MTRILLLNGTVGAGKTTVAAAIGAALVERGVPHAVLDADAVRRAWPTPPGDRFGEALGAENVGLVARSYAAAGAEVVVIACVVESATVLGMLERALGQRPWMCRLTVDPGVGAQRLRARHADPVERDWHLARAPELDASIDAAALDDVRVDTTGLDPAAIAVRVLELFGP